MNSTRSKKDIIKDARTALKKAMPQWTFSLTQPHYGSFHLNLMSGPVAALYQTSEDSWKDGYAQLNHYSFMDASRSLEDRCRTNGAHLTREAFTAICMATKIVNAENWDESDSMTDYFHCNYYLQVSVGKWDKPYQVKA